jgi:hypothetical protein
MAESHEQNLMVNGQQIVQPIPLVAGTGLDSSTKLGTLETQRLPDVAKLTRSK